MSPITTHVLDTARGSPAMGVPVLLEQLSPPSRWRRLAKGVTNGDGRVPDLLPSSFKLQKGIYRLTFETAAYFRACGARGFYPWATVVFSINEPRQHFHVPLLLSPFGYSTYRGS